MAVLRWGLNGNRFTAGFVFAVLLILCAAYLINTADFPFTDLDVLRHYQMDKLNKNLDRVETVILGDSAAGNAIDADLFSELSGQLTLNLALTGSFGFIGDYNLIKYLHQNAPHLKNIIIIHTLDIWQRPLSQEGYFDTMRYVNFPERYYWIFPWRIGSYLGYTMNLKKAAHIALSVLRGKEPSIAIDEKYDYIPQGQERFSNGRKIIGPDARLKETIKNTEMFFALDALCGEKSINCIYMHGPIHEIMFNNSTAAIRRIDAILKSATSIKYIDKIFHYESRYMGDSEDHIDPLYKGMITKAYFDALKSSGALR
ncbi:MAG: hypothetical protein WAP52_01835 [Candidatus Sungiibacteriota bacterium]